MRLLISPNPSQGGFRPRMGIEGRKTFNRLVNARQIFSSGKCRTGMKKLGSTRVSTVPIQTLLRDSFEMHQVARITNRAQCHPKTGEDKVASAASKQALTGEEGKKIFSVERGR